MATYEDWLKDNAGTAEELSGTRKPAAFPDKLRELPPGWSLRGGQQQSPGALGWSAIPTQRNVPLGPTAEPNMGPPAWIKQISSPPPEPELPMDEGLPEGFRMPQAPEVQPNAPVQTEQQKQQELKTFVPSVRDQMNEGIMRDWNAGIDRGLPWIGGGGGKWVTQMAQQANAPTQLRTDDPKMLRIASFANRVGIDPLYMAAYAGRESNFNQNAVGPLTRQNENALGDMQVTPATFAEMNKKYGGGQWNIKNPDDLTLAGAHRLADMIKAAGGDLLKAAAGYFGGPGNIPLFEKGIIRDDGNEKVGRKGTRTDDYANQVMARYNALKAQFGGDAAPTGEPTGRMQTVSTQEMPGTGPQDSGPLRQPIEIIRGLQRTAFDPFAQQEFVSAPPGVSPQIAALMTAVNRGLPAQVASQIVSGQDAIIRERMQQEGQTGRQDSVNRTTLQNTQTQTEAQGNRTDQVVGQQLQALIAEADARGATPAEKLDLIARATGKRARNLQLVNLPDREVQTGNPLNPVMKVGGGQGVLDVESGKMVYMPQTGPDKATVMREAQAAMRQFSITGPRRDAFINDLRSRGLGDDDLKALGLTK